MTKKSLIVKEILKKQLIERYADQRNALRKIINSKQCSPSEKLAAQFKMQKLPAKSAPARAKSRCNVTGRSKAFLRRFGLSRLVFREQALLGNIPGIKKSSW